MKSNSFKRGLCFPLYRRLKGSQTKVFPHKDLPITQLLPLDNLITIQSGTFHRPHTSKYNSKKKCIAIGTLKEEEFSLLPSMIFDDTDKQTCEVPDKMVVKPKFNNFFKVNRGFPVRGTRICRGLPRKISKIM